MKTKPHTLSPLPEAITSEWIALKDAAALTGLPPYALRKEARLVKRRLFHRDWISVKALNALICGESAEANLSPESRAR